MDKRIILERISHGLVMGKQTAQAKKIYFTFQFIFTAIILSAWFKIKRNLTSRVYVSKATMFYICRFSIEIQLGRKRHESHK